MNLQDQAHSDPSPASQTTPALQQPQKSGRRKSLLGIALALTLLVALAALAWYATHKGSAGDATRPGGGPGGRGGAAATVGVATAERADIPIVLDALGTVTAAATVTVRPQVSGVLKQVLFNEGQMVKAGQLLATIDPRPFELTLMQATGQRQRDEAQLENARLTLQRYRTLLSQDSIARQDVDTQAALVKQLEGTVTTDRAAEGTARLNLGYCRVLAPVSGRVGLRAVDAGNVVGTSDVNGIAAITQVSPIDVVFAIPQDQVAEVQARTHGTSAADDDKSGTQSDPKNTPNLDMLPAAALDRNRVTTLDSGRFLALDNQVDTQTGTVRAKARFPNEKLTLFPSQFVNVRLLLRTISGAVVVPVTALRHGSSGDFVYVLNSSDRTVALRPVTRGQATVDKIEITSGITTGEKVITEGADRLKDGAHVTLAGDKPASGAGGSGAGRGNGRRSGKPDSAAAASASNASTAGAPSASADAATTAPATPSKGEHRRRKPETAQP
ncbi:efflux RND transporter periplasmic adaptor subunit [Undibacterium arcticum]|uniref:Efflux RND transporter periplasmic adaptor subunit n=1 Tax=Undibacterium arcticum TaxID=1762892 RepID=A0ABV7F4P1_9BURK